MNRFKLGRTKGSELEQHRKQKAPTEVGASPFVPATWR